MEAFRPQDAEKTVQRPRVVRQLWLIGPDLAMSPSAFIRDVGDSQELVKGLRYVTVAPLRLKPCFHNINWIYNCRPDAAAQTPCRPGKGTPCHASHRVRTRARRAGIARAGLLQQIQGTRGPLGVGMELRAGRTDFERFDKDGNRGDENRRVSMGFTSGHERSR